MSMKKSSQAGFTIIELMIATSVFSIVLIIITSGVISFTRQYYKGIVTNTTQNVTRSVSNEISQALQFGSTGATAIYNTASPVAQVGYCISGKAYYYAKEHQLDTSNPANHALISSSDVGCPSSKNINVATLNFATSGLNQPRELLGDKMRLMDFTITDLGLTNPTRAGSYTIHIKVSYGDTDLLKADGSCKGGVGSEYCATSELTTTVVKRL
ncbi:hypothetical protein BH09PAT3_BH09PAT3_5860 [soil metagenome]